MEVMVDINPALFEQLGISYDDLSFFHDMGATVFALDLWIYWARRGEYDKKPFLWH